MPDLDHTFGGDLVLSGGTLGVSTSSDLTTQRLLRRLCTNPGAYLWDLEYGAGLPAMVGSPVSAEDVRAVIAAQMLLEAGVADTPSPQIAVTQNDNGFLYATVLYWATSGGDPITLQVPEPATDG